MEELLDTGGSVFSHDFRLFPYHLYGTYCSDISGKCIYPIFYLKLCKYTNVSTDSQASAYSCLICALSHHLM